MGPTMPATFDPLSTTTLSSNAVGVTFSSIPQTYTDLFLVASGRSTSNQLVYCQFNGDTGGNYSTTTLGDIGGANSGRQVNAGGVFIGAFDQNNTSSSVFQIMAYRNSSINKTVLTYVQYGLQSVQRHISLWRNTAAITSVYIYIAGGSNFVSGTTFSLYGIRAA